MCNCKCGFLNHDAKRHWLHQELQQMQTILPCACECGLISHTGRYLELHSFYSNTDIVNNSDNSSFLYGMATTSAMAGGIALMTYSKQEKEILTAFAGCSLIVTGVLAFFRYVAKSI